MTALKLRELLTTLLIALGLTFGSAGVAMADWGDEQDTQDEHQEQDTWDWEEDDDDDEWDDDDDW